MARKRRTTVNVETGEVISAPREQFGSYQRDIQNIISEFNKAANGKFIAESRVLVPAEGMYTMDKRGIIVEHHGKIEDFEKDFDEYQMELKDFTHKLDKRTTLYEYSFRAEFLEKSNWVDYDNMKVNYNYEL